MSLRRKSSIRNPRGRGKRSSCSSSEEDTAVDYMFNILVFIESRYPANRARIKATTSKFLTAEKVKSRLEVSVAIVGDRKMKRLNKTYRAKDETTSVLSFSLADTSGKESFKFCDDGILRLGDVVISYPQAVSRAREDNMRVDDEIDELVIHGLRNLIGKGE